MGASCSSGCSSDFPSSSMSSSIKYYSPVSRLEMTAARDEADEVSLLPLPADVFVKILLFVRNSRDLNSVARSCRVLNQLMTWRKLKRHVAGLLLEDESLVPMQLTRAHLDNLMRTVPQQTLSEFRPRGPIAKSNLSFELPLFVRPVYFALMGCKVGVDPAQYSGSFESPKGGFFHVVAVPYRPGQAVVHLRGAILRSNLHADALEDLDRMRNEAISTIGKNCLLFVHATVKRSVVLNEVLDWCKKHEAPLFQTWSCQEQLDGFIF